MNDEEVASYIAAMQKQEPPAYQQSQELDSLIGRSYAPSEEFREWSKSGSTDPDGAESKMNARERIKLMEALMRRNAEQNANLNETDLKHDRDMEQRYVDPRDYGSGEPSTPLISQYNEERSNPHETKMKWLGQMIEQYRHKQPKGSTSTAPSLPQLTGRFRDRVAF